MTYRAKHPAAFINALSEGPKADILEWLQRTWDELQDLHSSGEPEYAEPLAWWHPNCGVVAKVDQSRIEMQGWRPLYLRSQASPSEKQT